MDAHGGVQVRWDDGERGSAAAERIEVWGARAGSRQDATGGGGGRTASERIEARRRLASAVRPMSDSALDPVARIEVRPARMLEGGRGALLAQGVAGEARRAYEGLVPLPGARG